MNPQDNQDSPVESENGADEATDRQLNFSVFLKRYSAYQGLVYFGVDDPSTAGNIKWLYGTRNSGQQAMLQRAFDEKKNIRVWVGNIQPHSGLMGIVARVYRCQIEHINP